MRKTVLVLILAASLGSASFAQVPGSWSVKQKARDSASQQSEANKRKTTDYNNTVTPPPPPPKTTGTAPKSSSTRPKSTTTGGTSPATGGFTTTAGQSNGAHQAAMKGDVEALKALGAADPRVLHGRDAEGKTPVYLAAWRGNRDVVAYLIDCKVDLMTPDFQGNTPLHVAAANGHADIIVLLLEAGADPNAVSKDTGQTPLHRAAASGNVEATKALLAKGARKDVLDAKGKTPAQLAEYYQQGQWQDVTDALKKAP